MFLYIFVEYIVFAAKRLHSYSGGNLRPARPARPPRASKCCIFTHGRRKFATRPARPPPQGFQMLYFYARPARPAEICDRRKFATRPTRPAGPTLRQASKCCIFTHGRPDRRKFATRPTRPAGPTPRQASKCYIFTHGRPLQASKCCIFTHGRPDRRIFATLRRPRNWAPRRHAQLLLHLHTAGREDVHRTY